MMNEVYVHLLNVYQLVTEEIRILMIQRSDWKFKKNDLNIKEAARKTAEEKNQLQEYELENGQLYKTMVYVLLDNMRKVVVVK